MSGPKCHVARSSLEMPGQLRVEPAGFIQGEDSMPIFEYQCEECNATFERLILRPLTAAQMTCPQCGSPRTAKVLSTFSTTAGSSAPAGNTGGMSFR